MVPATASPHGLTLVQPHEVHLDIRADTQETAVLEVAELLANHPAMDNFEAFRRDLLAREAAGSTCLGGGVALPHARTLAVREIIVAAGRSAAGVRFQGLEEPVHLVFVVATPRSQITGYLATVGALARLLRDRERLQRLLECGSPAEFASLLPAA